MAKSLAALLLTSLSTPVTNDILREAMEQEIAEKKKLLVLRVKGIVNGAAAQLKSHVDTLKSYRRRANEQAAKVKELDRAVKFFYEEGNPLPYYKAINDRYSAHDFCLAAGIQMGDFFDEKNEEFKVPADWQPKDADLAAVDSAAE